jgi:hypothetical protein
MFKSLFLNVAANMIDRRTSLMPLMISFPSIGFMITTISALVGLGITHFYTRSDRMIS